MDGLIQKAPATRARAAAAVPASLLILFVGMLWLFGFACGKERREYVTTISETPKPFMYAMSISVNNGLIVLCEADGHQSAPFSSRLAQCQ